jgi:hypothetical protein
MKKNLGGAFLKSLKKGVGSGSIGHRYGSADPDPHQNVTDPQPTALSMPEVVGMMRKTDLRTLLSL